MSNWSTILKDRDLRDRKIAHWKATDPDTLEDLTTYFAEAIRPKETEPADAEA